jgi:hypothetical protein
MDHKTIVYSFLPGTGGVFIHGLNINAMQASKGKILVKMIYNNTGSAIGLKNDWGLSAWIDDAVDRSGFHGSSSSHIRDSSGFQYDKSDHKRASSGSCIPIPRKQLFTFRP